MFVPAKLLSMIATVVLESASVVPAPAPQPAAVEKPLLGAAGRPACGNVMKKSAQTMKGCD